MSIAPRPSAGTTDDDFFLIKQSFDVLRCVLPRPEAGDIATKDVLPLRKLDE